MVGYAGWCSRTGSASTEAVNTVSRPSVLGQAADRSRATEAKRELCSSATYPPEALPGTIRNLPSRLLAFVSLPVLWLSVLANPAFAQDVVPPGNVANLQVT